MTRSRLWWIVFVAVQSASLVGVTWGMACEWVDDSQGFLAALNDDSTEPMIVSVDAYRGYPFPWTGENRWYTNRDLPSDKPYSSFEASRNVALPVIALLIGSTVPWTLLTIRLRHPSSRITCWCRVVCLAAIATFTFAIFDIVTGSYPLRHGYHAISLNRFVLKNKHIEPLLMTLLTKRREEWGDMKHLTREQIYAWKNRTLLARTALALSANLTLGLTLFRPWRRPAATLESHPTEPQA